MKHFNLIPAILLALSPIAMNAQKSPVGINNSMPIHSKGGGGQIVTTKETMAASGSMFTNDNYMPAKLSGNTQVILLRYNAYSDHFEMSNGGKAEMLPKQAGVNVTLNTGEVYSLQNYKTEDGEEITGYLNVISDTPKVKIFKRERIYLQGGRDADNGYNIAKAPSYKKAADEFYIQINGGNVVFMDGKKDVANMVPGKSKEVLDFIKKNKIDLEDRQGLQKLGGYLDTIL